MSRHVTVRQDAVNSDRPVHTPGGAAFTAVVVGVLRLNNRLTMVGDELARPAGQTSARWQVLAAIEDQSATVAQIARRLELARQSVQRVADVLAEEGWAEYEDNPEHRRSRLLRLTSAGRRALRAIQVRQKVWADALGAEIGETTLRRTSAVLERMLRMVTGQTIAPAT